MTRRRAIAGDGEPHSSGPYLVLLTVVGNPLEVSAKEFQSLKMMIGQFVDLQELGNGTVSDEQRAE